jgi:hypothetical protein
MFTPAIAQSVAGAVAAERTLLRDGDRKRAVGRVDRPRRADDTVEIDAEATAAQAVDAVKNLAGNEQEETSDDRREHNHYDLQPKVKPSPLAKRLDVQG